MKNAAKIGFENKFALVSVDDTSTFRSIHRIQLRIAELEDEGEYYCVVSYRRNAESSFQHARSEDRSMVVLGNYFDLIFIHL